MAKFLFEGVERRHRRLKQRIVLDRSNRELPRGQGVPVVVATNRHDLIAQAEL
jgi:hypothetical protein